MLFALLGILIGVVVGLLLPFTYNPAYALYISVAILACLDSVFGGIRANLENKFDAKIFISGFFGNAILAAFLAYLGDRRSALLCSNFCIWCKIVWELCYY